MHTILKLSTPDTHRTSTILTADGKAFARVYAGDETSRQIIKACNREAVGHEATCMQIMFYVTRHENWDDFRHKCGGFVAMLDTLDEMAQIVTDWEVKNEGLGGWGEVDRDWDEVCEDYVHLVIASVLGPRGIAPTFQAMFDQAMKLES